MSRPRPRPTEADWRRMLANLDQFPPDMRDTIAKVARLNLPKPFDGPGGAELAADQLLALAALDREGDALAPNIAALREGLRRKLVDEGVLLEDDPE